METLAAMPTTGLRLVAPRHDGPAAIFLDKDGTLIDDVPYNVDPRHMRFAPGALRGVLALVAAGFKLFVVSNQPGVALGLHRTEDLQGVEDWLTRRFGAHGVNFSGVYWCPHHPQGLVASYAHLCDCRKPRPGLIQRAAREHGIDLRASWMIGDVLDDVEAGRRAGCRTVMIDNGNETVWRRSPLRVPDWRARDLAEAAALILGTSTRLGTTHAAAQ